MHSQRAKLMVELARKKRQKEDAELSRSSEIPTTIAGPSSDQTCAYHDFACQQVIYSDSEFDDSMKDPNWNIPDENTKSSLSNHFCEDISPISSAVLANAEVDDQPPLFLTLCEIEENTNSISLPRKRSANPEQWVRKQRKIQRSKGESYSRPGGKVVKEKSSKRSSCLSKPGHSGCKRITEDERNCIFSAFYELADINLQRQFIASHVRAVPKKRCTNAQGASSRRNFSNQYNLTVSAEEIYVCKEFFMKALDVTDALIRSSVHLKRNENGIVECDKRGLHKKGNQVSQEHDKFIRQHINSFPKMESHYCRKSSEKLYLEPNLNLSKMYRLYKDLCEENELEPVGWETYRKIFREYKLGFFSPKKDKCNHCTKYEEMDATEKEACEEEHQNHLRRKEQARALRNKDKEDCKRDPDIAAFNFDLQAVLTTPKSDAGQIFYRRKLAVYNFTIYNFFDQSGTCYLWDESNGKRGVNEIASCISSYLDTQTVKQVRMMSDGCPGQQKNTAFAGMCLYLVATHPTIEELHRFLETGHTQMECDSVHSKIEKSAKRVAIYTPAEWATSIKLARQNPKPFDVKQQEFSNFKDFKKLRDQTFPSVLKDKNGSKVIWNKIIMAVLQKTRSG